MEINFIDIDNYEATKKQLAEQWYWQPLEALPDIELTPIYGGEHPNSKLLKQALFSGFIVLKGEDGNYYSAYMSDIPFKQDWRDDGYTDFGVFTVTDKISYDIYPESMTASEQIDALFL